MKKWVAVILTLVILAFIFADRLSYLAGRWQEKTGKVKKAVRTYSRLIEKRPRSKWATKAKEAIERLEKTGEEQKRGDAGTSKPTTYTGVLKQTERTLKAIEEEKNKEWLKEMEK